MKQNNFFKIRWLFYLLQLIENCIKDILAKNYQCVNHLKLVVSILFVFSSMLSKANSIGDTVYFIVSTGTKVVVSGDAHLVGNNFVFNNNGTYNDSAGQIDMGNGLFSGTGTTNLYNLYINASSGTAKFNSLVSVNNTATLYSGNVQTNNFLFIRSDKSGNANVVINTAVSNNIQGISITATALSGACPYFNSTLSLNVSGSAVVYQWQSSLDSISWSDIFGATSDKLNATVTLSSFYRCHITANNSSFNIFTKGIRMTLGNSSSSTSYQTICPSNFPFTWNGLTFNSAGTQTAHLSNSAGCDSAATLILTTSTPVIPSISIAANPLGAILSSTTVTFTATPTNGGFSPMYQWKKNGSNVGTNSTAYTDASFVNGDVITCVLTANNNCQSATTVSSNGITMNVTATITWTGAVSTDWNVVGNWNVHIVPTVNSNVSIPSVPRLPVLSTDFIVDTLYLGGSMAINGHTLTINGAIIGNGFLKGSQTSSLIIAGAVGTILFDVNSNTLANLTITNSGAATLGNALNIVRMFTPASGTINTGDYLTLKSTSIDNTAVVGIVGGAVNGKVTVERFIPNGLRTYRDLGASGVANAGSIFDNWQESGVNTNGYGIYITGSQGVLSGIDPVRGFDYSLTGNHSLFTYTNNNWDSILSTKGTALNPYQGYRVLVRGNRTGSLQYQLPYMWSNATLRTTGNLITGQVRFSTLGVSGSYPSSYRLVSDSGNYNFIANPYSSIVDWEAVAAQSQNVNQSYWYCDPTNTNDGTSSGYTVFVGYNALSHTASNPLGTSLVNRYLQPGQAFFVENSSSSAPVVVFNESNKVPIESRMGIFGTLPVVNRIAVGLSKAGKNVDGAVSVFGTSFSKSIGAEDAIKFSNVSENVAFTLGGKDLCINGFTLPTAKDVLPIHLYNLNANTVYSLRLDVSQFTSNGMSAYLKDNVSGTQIKLEGDSTIVSFSTNATNAVSFANRYGLVFQAATLPVSNITAIATPLKGNQVAVKWSVVGEAKVETYSVEHSVDGLNFNRLITIGGSATNNYSFIDENAVEGTNYYRIIATDLNSRITCSNVVLLTSNHSSITTIKVYPNPLVGSNLYLTFGNLEAGKYNVGIFNKLGQRVFETVINHIGAANPENVKLGKQLATGTYTLQVVGIMGSTYQTEIEVK